MKEIERSKVERIIEMHSQIMRRARLSLEDAIKIGELLSEEKRKLQHGEWGNWINENLPFTASTAATYMRLYLRKDEFEEKGIADLKGAYKLITPAKRLPGGGERHVIVKASEIDYNPYFDLKQLKSSWVTNYTHAISNIEDDDLFRIRESWKIVACRQVDNRYECIADNHYLAALKAINYDRVEVSLVDLNDDQMKNALQFEPESEVMTIPGLYEYMRVEDQKRG